jgi:CBS domain-containing protein
MTHFAEPAPAGSRPTARDLMLPPDVTVAAGTTVAEVTDILVDAVPVLDEERDVLGLVTVHAVVRAAAYPSASAEARPAA